MIASSMNATDLQFLCCVLVMTAASNAQDAASEFKPGKSVEAAKELGVVRKRVSGIASTSQGKPWAGATITLYSRLHPANTAPAYTDMLQVKSDARGRFRAKILPGRAYSAWALGEADENGSYSSSPIVENIFPGSSFRLKAYAGKNRQRELSLEYRKDWKDYEPLQCMVLQGKQNKFRVLLQSDASGKLTLPKLAGKRCRIIVFGKNELPILSKTVSLEDKAVDAKASANALTLELPYPSKMLVRVIYNPNGRGNRGPGLAAIPKAANKADAIEKPIAGAVVSRQLPSTSKIWYPLGQTDKDGFAVVVVPTSRAPRGRIRMTLKASSPSYSSNSQYQSDFRPEKGRDIDKLRQSKQPDATIYLMDGFRIKGRILSADGTPAAGMPLFLYYSTASSHNSWTHFREPAIFTTKADGSFELYGVHVSCGFRITGVLDGSNLAALSRKSAFPLHPLVVLAVTAGSGKANEDLDLGEIMLANLERLDIKVESADGHPVAKPQLILGEPTMYINGKMGPYHPFRFTAGRLGRISILVNKSKDMVLVAAHEGASKVVPLAFDEHSQAKHNGNAWPMHVILDTGVRLLGSVTDSAGQGIARASISLHRRSSSKGGSRLLSFVSRSATKSDANGRFSIVVHPNSSYGVSASVRIDGKYYRTKGDQVISVDDSGTKADEVELEIDLPKRGGK